MIGDARKNRRFFVFVLAFLAFTAAWSGCIRQVRDYYGFEPEEHYVNPGVFPGNYRMADAGGSTVLSPRRLVEADPEIYRLPSSHPHSVVSAQPETTQPPTESAVYITMAAWLPNNGSGEKAPVILVASPFFELGNESLRNATEVPLVAWLLRNYLPLGYAVAIVSVRGSGTSGGCMEFLGPREAADLDQAVRFLATQEWSNGAVAMFGAGYAGATPWLVAASGNEFLKTIVPISGWADTYGLLYHNGTIKAGAILQHPALWGTGFSGSNNPPPRPTEVPEPGYPVPPGTWLPRPFSANGREAYQDRQNLLCDEAYEGFGMSGYSTTLGDRGRDASDFWAQRDYRQRVIDNYDGSVFLIHGLQDWIVDPHVTIPFNQDLRAAGIEIKEWYGQWRYASPDSECPKSAPVWRPMPCRLDFAETLLHWFEHHLKNNQTVDLGPALQVQDDRGYWRNADTFPPVDAVSLDFHLNGDGTLRADATPEQRARLAPPIPATAGSPNPPRNVIQLTSEPFAEATRISGLIQLDVAFESVGSGGSLSAWLFDDTMDDKSYDRWYENPSSGLWYPNSILGEPPIIAHAQLDLRYRDGGDTSTPIVPGERYTARMQFEPVDLLIPQGHRLTLWLLQYPYPGYEPGRVASAVDVVLGEESTIRLPTIQVDPTDVFPVPGSQYPAPPYFAWPHVRKPDYPELASPGTSGQ